MENSRVILKNIITIVGSILIFIITIETSARMDDKIKYNAQFFAKYSSALLRDADSEGLNRNIPNNHFEKWKINQLGFRGPDIPLIKSNSVKRIVCMGTSETFGLYESPGQEWPNQLTNMLGRNSQFQIINASVVGLSLKKYRRYIEKYILKLEPDIIILYINPFDYAVGVERFVQRQSTPERESSDNKKTFRRLLNEIPSNLRLLPKLKEAVKKVVPPNLLKLYRLWNMKKQLHNLEYKQLNGRKPIDVVPQESLTSFKSDLEAIIQFLHNRKIEIILTSYPVLISPENIDKYLEIFLDHRRFYVELSFEGIIDAVSKFNDIIKVVAKRYGTGFVDNNRYLPKNIKYFADNVHYTDEGARLIALSFIGCLKEFRDKWE